MSTPEDVTRRTLIFAQIKRDLERGLKACDEYARDARNAEDEAKRLTPPQGSADATYRAVEARKASARRKRESTLAAGLLELLAMLEEKPGATVTRLPTMADVAKPPRKMDPALAKRLEEMGRSK